MSEKALSLKSQLQHYCCEVQRSNLQGRKCIQLNLVHLQGQLDAKNLLTQKLTLFPPPIFFFISNTFVYKF